ncbi:hypothetical protein HNP40_000362 [Mycobacteroides chelonae]|nr:hypothetical protein [Mycobacteroides chelonae]
MEKVVFALRQPSDTATDEYAEQLRTAATDKIWTAGARGLTVCVHDAAVRAAGLPLMTLDPPFAAAVSVWVQQSYSPAVSEIEAVLAATSATVHGYLVTESALLRRPAAHTNIDTVATSRYDVMRPF